MSECFFCNNIGGELLVQNDLFRVILLDDANYPGYMRVVLNQHIKELTDLSDADNLLIYQAVIKCERIMRTIMNPTKVNIASFGNMTPHIHWHIIPRYTGDLHFPNPTWGEVTNSSYIPSAQLIEQIPQLVQSIKNAF